MKTAHLFPGQGAQHVGMGHDLYEQFEVARQRFDQADALLGFSLAERMFGQDGDAEGAAAFLQQTDITQPALYVHSLAATAVLNKYDRLPDMTAGHSLGEYSALAAAEAITFEDGLRVVRLRGQLMAEAGAGRAGTMGAVLGLEDDQVAALCDAVSAEGGGLVQPANFNAPGQVVISGDVDAVARAMERARTEGALKVVPLAVSGAFHSPLMGHARDGLAEALAALPIRVPRCPVYLNVSAQPSRDPEEIRARLLEQLMAPVRWSQTLQHMQDDGATQFVEVGTGRVLSGLVKRTLGRRTHTATFGTAADLEALTASVS